MTEMKNKIVRDHLDEYEDAEILPYDAPMCVEAAKNIQHEVDEWMESFDFDAPEEYIKRINARIDTFRKTLLLLREAGIQIPMFEIPSEWKLFGMSKEEWKMQRRYDEARGNPPITGHMIYDPESYR